MTSPIHSLLHLLPGCASHFLPWEVSAHTRTCQTQVSLPAVTGTPETLPVCVTWPNCIALHVLGRRDKCPLIKCFLFLPYKIGLKNEYIGILSLTGSSLQHHSQFVLPNILVFSHNCYSKLIKIKQILKFSYSVSPDIFFFKKESFCSVYSWKIINPYWWSQKMFSWIHARTVKRSN